ncbi:hypothetical protein Vafri_20765, partial [Volvox africanus]
VMAGPRRTTSFQQRPGTALQPTAQRLRSSTTLVRRTSIEACVQQLSQQQPQQPAQPPPSAQQQQFQRGSGRGSLEGRQIWFAALSASAEQLPPSGRRTGSLEIPRPYSAAAAAAARLHPAVVESAVRFRRRLRAPPSDCGCKHRPLEWRGRSRWRRRHQAIAPDPPARRHPPKPPLD